MVFQAPLPTSLVRKLTELGLFVVIELKTSPPAQVCRVRCRSHEAFRQVLLPSREPDTLFTSHWPVRRPY